ncbi:MAG: hypothetical protein COV57_02435 [Candidatus Liptonbacteria bacterium CG11_big_fil_rev_8_21_14_0_20_35_14]|uniref:Uncharacterized protein n=1 Tax=Candidatus Liptonbacteria bacterium CG11_big_fil_rev_8_21_14_0_20_35_14 TaxID=1974634 RepID=A0A2H0N7C8_9BACT|nr:MAG: hypothetical protein COV57_02435 [Candidatus Liptonbacteria bacterium CG11_big_fil_rev_8_21_14_0_20_35_14]
MKNLSNQEISNIFLEIFPNQKKQGEKIKDCSIDIFSLIKKNLEIIEQQEGSIFFLRQCKIQPRTERIIVTIVRSGEEVAKTMYKKPVKKTNVQFGDRLDPDKREKFEDNHWNQQY